MSEFVCPYCGSDTEELSDGTFQCINSLCPAKKQLEEKKQDIQIERAMYLW